MFSSRFFVLHLHQTFSNLLRPSFQTMLDNLLAVNLMHGTSESGGIWFEQGDMQRYAMFVVPSFAVPVKFQDRRNDCFPPSRNPTQTLTDLLPTSIPAQFLLQHVTLQNSHNVISNLLPKFQATPQSQGTFVPDPFLCSTLLTDAHPKL